MKINYGINLVIVDVRTIIFEGNVLIYENTDAYRDSILITAVTSIEAD